VHNHKQTIPILPTMGSTPPDRHPAAPHRQETRPGAGPHVGPGPCRADGTPERDRPRHRTGGGDRGASWTRGHRRLQEMEVSV